MGKIGVSVSGANNNVVYAIIESDEGGFVPLKMMLVTPGNWSIPIGYFAHAAGTTCT